MSIHKAKDYVEVYRLKAKARDIHELSGRSGQPELTEYIAKQILRELDPGQQDVLVDVGCGDGTLLRIAAEASADARPARLLGVLPTEEEVARVKDSLTASAGTTVKIIRGLSQKTGLPDGFATRVAINGVLIILGNETLVDETLAELRRITKHGGIVMIGELPDQDEFSGRNYGDSIAAWLLWVLRHRGFRAFRQSSTDTARRIFSNQPFIISPKKNFWIAPDAFLEKLANAGFHVITHYRHKEIDRHGNERESPTRWDYVTRRE